MLSSVDHGFVAADDPKPGPAMPRGVGQVRKPKQPMPVGDLNVGRHAGCVEHVNAAGGLREPVCIKKGQDRDAVLAAVRELIGGTR